MCGIFGFISNDGDGPNVNRLKRIAVETERRGRHAFGLAWLDADGEMHTFKRPGAASDDLSDLERVEDALVVLGHCRWATHGSPEDNRNNHPHRAGRGWIVHNGQVTNYQDLVARHRLEMRTACDTEVLGMMFSRGRGSVEDRGVWMANRTYGKLAVLGVWANPARLLVIRRDNPLWYGRSGRGRYLASLRYGLPDTARKIRNATARVLTCNVATPDDLWAYSEEEKLSYWAN